MSIKTRGWIPYAGYGLISALILGPLLRPGYVLALDMTFTPRLRMPSTVTSSYLFHVLLRLLNAILPGDVIEKLVLFIVFFAAGIGMYRLIQSVRHGSAYDAYGAYVGGICYAVNPFTYDRLMAGQYSVLLGYAFLPFFIQALLSFLRMPGWRLSLRIALWATFISIVSIHMVGVMVILTGIGLVGETWRRRGQNIAGIWKFTVVATIVFVLAGSYWLVPLILGEGTTATEISSFGQSDNNAFGTTGWGLPGKLSNVAHLQGFWAEDRGLFVLPQARLSGLWNELSLLLLSVIAVGVAWSWRTRYRFMLGFFTTSIVIGSLLALGALAPLARHVQLLEGYREPQKFVVLVAIGYSVFIGVGVPAIIRRTKQFMQSSIYANGTAIVLLGVPFVFTSTLLWGARGQLSAQAYPADWTAANELLDADPTLSQTLFLPWHAYMYFGFAARITSNPAPAFFDKPVIVSDNSEFEGVAPVQTTTTKQSLDRLLPTASHGTTLGRQLANLHIKYILLDHDDDYQAYAYLNYQSGLRQVFAGHDLVVYKNKDFVR